MRFTRLVAQAHGPLTGETLTPAPGFTVVWGLNEAGKSSWHSAAHLAITGLSRKRGRPTKGEQQIIDRRKPRTGEPWRLEAGLRLDDGDDLTVSWDLNQRVAKVLDGLGRDRSNEWLTDGAPDLARIVGLDRASFLATACVRQSDLLRVRHDADLLQDLLQKATTSADADSTASSAIALIDQCRRDQVGLERENSTKPLMEARRRVEATNQALTAAQDAHRERLDLLAELTDRQAELADRRAESELLELALAVAEARGRNDERLRQRQDIQALAQHVEDLTAEMDLLGHREKTLLASRRACDLIDRWANRPAVPTITGPTVAQLSQQLASLPDTPITELEGPAGSDEWGRTPPDRGVAATAADTNTPLMVASVGVAVFGLVLGFVVHPLLYIVAVAGVVSALLTLHQRMRPTTDADRDVFHQRLELAEAAERAGRHDALAAQLVLRRDQERQAAEVEATLELLDRDLSVLATEIGIDPELPGEDRVEALIRWLPRHSGRPRHLASARHEPGDFKNLLDGGALDVLADTDDQVTTCRDQHARLRQERDEAAGQLRHLQTAATQRPPPSRRSMTAPASDPAITAVSAAALLREIEQSFSARPDRAVVGFTLDTLPPIDELHAQIDAVGEQERQLRHLVAGLDGRLQERDAAGAITGPAAAVESHQSAVRELARVRDLAAVLDETRALLVTAEGRVHRDIAPQLNTAVNRWLPRIFGDRYTKVLIDPANLDVQVFSAGDAQRADLLSQGTTEQFYLLLRVALTEALTFAGGESCPLLLDDITVNFDRERKVAVLHLLREVAAERQVILFTQEDDVHTWAEANLSGANTLIELPGRVTV